LLSDSWSVCYYCQSLMSNVASVALMTAYFIANAASATPMTAYLISIVASVAFVERKQLTDWNLRKPRFIQTC
jgi:hypothetical protein